jgi:predicted extracellular nuclease
VDFVYDANTVTPISEKPAESNVEVQNRKKMMLFRENATGEKFIYSINHFKAMNTGDEARRVNEAKAVVDLYQQYSRNPKIRDKDVLFMGDLNCYAFTAPIRQFTDRGMIDLHRAFHNDSSYSYMFSGMASYIDHALCNATLYRQITGMSAYHINSDEDDNYNYERSNDQTMFRCSDHDPVLVGLKLDSTLLVDPLPSINTFEVLTNNLNTITIRDAYNEGKASYYAIYTMQGGRVDLQPITSIFQEVQLPDDPGIYILYIYADDQVYQHKFIVP